MSFKQQTFTHRRKLIRVIWYMLMDVFKLFYSMRRPVVVNLSNLLLTDEAVRCIWECSLFHAQLKVGIVSTNAFPSHTRTLTTPKRSHSLPS